MEHPYQMIEDALADAKKCLEAVMAEDLKLQAENKLLKEALYESICISNKFAKNCTVIAKQALKQIEGESK